MFVCTVRLTNSFLHIVGALQQLDCTSSAALRILVRYKLSSDPIDNQPSLFSDTFPSFRWLF
ncbi:hypothetical protein SEVIR_9G501166v4 [Setaria viridis]